jgi:RsiW-degrading membrane proteinase PrsW (M82 family)
MDNAFKPNPVAAAPPLKLRRSGLQSAIKIVLAIIATMFALLLGLIILLLIGAETGPVEMMIGLVCATLPVPLYVMLILWIDRYEAEPLWMLVTSFFWGALISVFIAMIFNTSIQRMAEVATNSAEIGENIGAVISAPIVEEGAKAFILFILFFWKKDEFDGIVDGIVYAGMVGLGFAMTENILYYSRAVQRGTGMLTFVVILRGMIAPFSHPLFTSMTGIGLGWARQSDNGFIKVTMPVLGLMLAMLLHGTWNGSAALGGGWVFLVTYFMIMGPALIVTLMVVHFSLRREGNIVRQFLYSDYRKGLFAAHEYEKLCTIRGRMGMSWNAFWSQGFSSWRTRRRCNQIASELAFHRSRVARGFGRDPQTARDRESLYLDTLRELRQQLPQRQPGKT